MYQGMRKEIYILCFGRFVTAMGSLVWPMLTLILKNKLHMDAEQVALWFLLFGVFQIPFGLAGGKLTDKYNKRNMILIFDLLSVALYCITALLHYCLLVRQVCGYILWDLYSSIWNGRPMMR